MKVLLLTKYDYSGASSRYRTLQYLSILKEKGIDIVTSPLLDSHHIKKIFAKQKVSFLYYLRRYFKRIFLLLLKRKKFDVVWIEGEIFPYVPFFLENFFLPNRYVAEYDDAIFHNYDQHRFFFIRRLLGKKIDQIMSKSQHVVVGNEYVKNHAYQAGAKKVTILPTVVDAMVYAPDSPVLCEENIPVVIGWLGSPTTVKYLKLIESVFVSIAKKANIKLSVIGGEYCPEGVPTECYHWPNEWSEAEEIAYLKKIDIGIMPLIDSPWEQGKCGFKLIKYMACAKPMVASPVSTNKEIVIHGENGYLANTLEEWESYLLALIRDADKRQRFGEAGRKNMLETYSLQVTAPMMCHILKAVN